MKIELYDYEAAACATKIRWLLAEEGLKWARQRIDLLDFQHKSETYLAIHPKGLVPAIRIDEEVITDADDAMLRIASAPGSAIGPENELVEQLVREWLELISAMHMGYGAVYYDQVFLPYHRDVDKDVLERKLQKVAEPKTRSRMEFLIASGIDREHINQCLAGVRKVFEHADEVLKNNPWLAGDHLTIADIGLFPYVNSPMAIISHIWADGLAFLEDWLARMRMRPAYTESVVNYPYETELWNAFLRAPGGGGFRHARLLNFSENND